MADERHCSECGGKLPSDAPQGLCPQCLMKAGLPTEADGDKADSSQAPSGVPTSATAPSGFVPPQPTELAQQFPHLEIIELLGQGGMGAVYKARQKQLDRLVALKILPPQVGQDPAFAERFTREARSLARLNHPHIVTVHDFGKTEAGLYYFLMEFVDGTDLRRVIQAEQLRPAEALAVIPQICEALQYAHDEGIVHRDIKPENVLLDKRGRVRIADFGLAKLLDRPATVYTLTRAGQRMGTPHYMAPEQIEHPDQVDHRADIYSLGVVFYEMLTGELPIGRFAPPSQKVQVDVRLDDVVLRTLEKEPQRRYQHASEVKTDVEAISSGGEPAPAGEKPEPQAQSYAQQLPSQKRFSRAAIVGACWASLVLLLIPFAIMYLTPIRVVRSAQPQTGIGPGITLVGLVMGLPSLLGLTAPFGTTILGIAAITHIRHSLGRLYGMGLALFDALLFPLLALNIAILTVFLLAGMGISEAIILTLIICGLLDFFLIRWAWRKANEGLGPTPHHSDFATVGTVPTTAEKERARGYQHASEVKPNVEAISSGSPPTPPGVFAGHDMQVSPMDKHIIIVAVLNIVFGAMGVLAAAIVFTAFVGGGRISQDPAAMRITSLVGSAIAIFLVVTSVPEIIGGIGLLKRRPWARILVIVIAVLDLIQIPIGTIIGIYELWVLFSNETARLFAHASAKR
jgi:tRNA A-37 threonylcarbamoyl transferase component Bud32